MNREGREDGAVAAVVAVATGKAIGECSIDAVIAVGSGNVVGESSSCAVDLPTWRQVQLFLFPFSSIIIIAKKSHRSLDQFSRSKSVTK